MFYNFVDYKTYVTKAEMKWNLKGIELYIYM